jgi:predicted flap endonuclease-1-like 5' DNA nuclease
MVAWFIGQSAAVILLAFLLGVLVGWLLRAPRRQPAQGPPGHLRVLPVTPPAEAAAERPAPSVTGATRLPRPPDEVEPASHPPASPAPASPGRPLAGGLRSDNLQQVEGVGPRISSALHSAGIHTFEDLANTDTATLQAALQASGLRFAPNMSTWPEQARMLADRR